MKRATVEEEMRKNAQLKQEDIDTMRDWVTSQPHLPPITDLTLVLFLHCSYYDVEVAKCTLDKFYAFLYSAPHISIGRDATKEDIIQIAKAVGVAILNGLDKEGNNVFILRILDTDPSRFDMDLILKLSHMLITVWHLEHGTGKGSILIYDQRGVTLSHLARTTVSALRNTLYYIQDCAPVNVVGIYVIYTNALIDAILAFFRPFMRSSLYKLIKTFRGANLQGLYEIVPQEILPKEYGGKEPSMEELSASGLKKLTEYREFFLEEDKKIEEAATRAKSTSPGMLSRVGAWFGFSS